MKSIKELFEWLGDKEMVILTIAVFGIYALYQHQPGALELIEKLGYGLLGLATGKVLAKK